MSGFIAGGTAEAFTLVNDGFWPDIDADRLRAAQRIDATVTNARLEVAAVSAMLAVNRDLSAAKVKWQAEGHGTLAEVPADHIAGASMHTHAYRRAVYSLTSAEVAERYRTYDTTNSGTKAADQEEPSADDYRRDARHAVRDILGIGHATVELI
jgi:hypothetical protein